MMSSRQLVLYYIVRKGETTMKKSVALFLSLLLLTAVVSALAQEEPITITLYWTALTDSSTQAWMNLIADYESKNPGYAVEFITNSDVSDTTRIQLAAGGGPDIWMMDAFDIMDFAQAGYLMDLTEMAEKNGWDEKLYDWAYGSCTYNGLLYAMPYSSEVTMLNLNQKLLDQYGWTAPTTREEFVALCDACLENDIIPCVVSYLDMGGLLSQWAFDHYINAVAGSEKLIAVLKNEAKWTDPQIVEAFQMLVDDYQAGYFGQALAIDNNESRAIYLSGVSLMNMEGTWFTFEYNDESLFTEDLQNVITLWPSFNQTLQQPTSITCGEVIGVNAKANAEAVEKFFHFLMTDDEAVCKAAAGGVIPPCRDVDLSYLPEDTSQHVVDSLNAIKTLPQSTDNVGYAPWGFYPTTCNQYLYENIGKPLMGNITVEEYLQNAQECFEQDLANGYVFVG